MSKFISGTLIVAVFAIMLPLSGCGDRKNEAVGPPIPDTPREVDPQAGAPLLLFGRGGVRGDPGEDDEAYQEYLLWKEWQQYQKYLEWLRTNKSEQPSTSQDQ